MSDDYVERPVEGKNGGYCASCNTIKPIAEFKRLLTYAETKARGYKGDYRVELLVHTCKSCQPKRTPLARMTRKQIHNAVEAGDVRPLDAEYRLSVIAQQERDGKRRGAYSRRVKELKAKWAPLIFALNRDMATLHQQEKYAKTRMRPAILAYATRYKEILTMVRHRMRKDCDDLRIAPPEDWRTHVLPHEMDEIKGLWSAIPNEQRHRMTIPALLKVQYTPPEYMSKGKPIKTVEMMPDGPVLVDERVVHKARVHRERMDFMDEVRMQKEAERAALLAHGLLDTPAPAPIDMSKLTATARPTPPRLRTATDKMAKQATDELLSDLGLNK